MLALPLGRKGRVARTAVAVGRGIAATVVARFPLGGGAEIYRARPEGRRGGRMAGRVAVLIAHHASPAVAGWLGEGPTRRLERCGSRTAIVSSGTRPLGSLDPQHTRWREWRE